jgi:hypothetical protein
MNFTTADVLPRGMVALQSARALHNIDRRRPRAPPFGQHIEALVIELLSCSQVLPNGRAQDAYVAAMRDRSAPTVKRAPTCPRMICPPPRGTSTAWLPLLAPGQTRAGSVVGDHPDRPAAARVGETSIFSPRSARICCSSGPSCSRAANQTGVSQGVQSIASP